jgi:hypothetical protein
MAQSLKGDRDPPMASVEPSEMWDEVQRKIRSTQPDTPSAVPVVEHFSPDDPMFEKIRALRRDGAIIIDRAVTEGVCDDIKAEMQPYLDVTTTGDGFLGKQTKRAGACVSRSPASWKCILHPSLMQLCEGVLGRQVLHMSRDQMQATLTPGNKQLPWQLSLSQLICIGPHNRQQPMHQDGWGFVLDMKGPGAGQTALDSRTGQLENEISTIWALQDFSAENGATTVAPGSHLWPSGRGKPAPEEITQAVMPKGSVLIYLGTTWHGGGENKTDHHRYGLNIDYNLGLLR